jgi:hypothetical protein
LGCKVSAFPANNLEVVYLEISPPGQKPGFFSEYTFRKLVWHVPENFGIPAVFSESGRMNRGFLQEQ